MFVRLPEFPCNHFIYAVWAVRAATGLNLKEAKAVVDRAPQAFEIPDAAFPLFYDEMAERGIHVEKVEDNL